MEEFKKWLERGEPGEGVGRYPRFGTVDEDSAAGKGWRAAFENMENWIRGRRCTGEDMLEYIYKELGRNY